MGASIRRRRDVFDNDGQSRRMAPLIGAASLEISPREELAGEGLREWLDAGTRVFVNHPPGVTHHDIVAACRKLRRAGFLPVPHIAVRRLASFTQGRDFIERASGEAGVKSVLLTGGDPDHPVGPFEASLDLLATGVVEQHGIGEVVFTGYPEGHPRIDGRTLDAALDAKLALAHQRGLKVSLLTQFGFDPEAIHRWIAARRARSISCPVRVGLSGPASVATLAQFAFRCGVGASLRSLARGQAAFARILAEAAPDDFIAALLAGEDAAAPIDALHFFTFGGVGRTAEWTCAHAIRQSF
jgi:methylenetetrahydrofolate reductase (NADPH)